VQNSPAVSQPDELEKPTAIVLPDSAEIVAESEGDEVQPSEFIDEPGKVIRIGSMVKQLLEEVRQSNLDEASRARLAEIYDTSIDQISDVISPELREELESLTAPFKAAGVPSEAELRVAHAQLVGWLEGLFHGIQATLFAQQLSARTQLEQMRRGSLPATTTAGDPHMPGTYL